MTSIAIHFRASSKTGRHQGHLFFRLIHMRKIKTVKTSYRVFPEEWDKENQRVIFPKENADREEILLKVEEDLRCEIARMDEIIKQKQAKGHYQVEDVVEEYSANENSNLLLQFTKKLSAKLSENNQVRTARAYQTATNGLALFCGRKDIALNQINASLLKDFEASMKFDNKCPNTISFYMRNLRAIYNKAVQDKRIPRKLESPFSQVYTGIKVTRKRALNREELLSLAQLDLQLIPDQAVSRNEYLSCKNLNLSHKLFLFCFYARGISFIDLAFLKKENVKDGILSYYRKKTGQLIEIKMTKYMKSIVNHFENDVKYSYFLFPIICDARKSERLQYETALRIQNGRLKKLAKLAHIEKQLSTHVARHTWATLAKQAHFPLGIISEALGHSNEKTTSIYLASFERSVLDSVNEKITKGIYPKQVTRA